MDTKKLRELAEKATQGEWVYESHAIGAVTDNPDILKQVASASGADAAYIAAANPQAIIELLDRVERLNAELIA